MNNDDNDDSAGRFLISDHDLLIKLYMEVKSLRSEILALRQKTQADFHDINANSNSIEGRIRSLENWRWYLLGIGCAFITLSKFIDILLKLM